jgi:uncharacterized membrane protein (DUF2068 family)
MEETRNGPAPTALTTIEPLRWIGAYKLLKAVLSLLGALMILRLMHRNLPDIALRWMARLHIEPHSALGMVILHRILMVKRRSLGVVAGLLFAYIPLAIAEGIGLILRKVWAEWLTVVTTAAMIPLEIYEVARRPSWLRVLILVVNIAVLLYLVVRIKRDRGEPLTADSLPLNPPSPAEGHSAQSTTLQPPVPQSDVPG